jgi:hypothetical protein
MGDAQRHAVPRRPPLMTVWLPVFDGEQRQYPKERATPPS